MTQTALTKGAHHIGLTVPDLDQATAFFRDALGFAVVRPLTISTLPDAPTRSGVRK